MTKVTYTPNLKCGTQPPENVPKPAKKAKVKSEARRGAEPNGNEKE